MATATHHTPGLYISEDGRIECAKHLPYAGSDTHLAGRYVRLTVADEAAWRREIATTPIRIGLTCEVCHATRLQAEENA